MTVPGSACVSDISTVVVEFVTLLRIRVSNPASNNVTLSLVTLACQFPTGITVTCQFATGNHCHPSFPTISEGVISFKSKRRREDTNDDEDQDNIT